MRNYCGKQKKTAAETKKSFSQLLEEALKEIMEEEGVYETRRY